MTAAAVVAAALLARGLTMGELFALCGFATLPVAVLIAAWVLRRTLLKTADAASSCGCSIASRSKASSTRARRCRTR